MCIHISEHLTNQTPTHWVWQPLEIPMPIRVAEHLLPSRAEGSKSHSPSCWERALLQLRSKAFPLWAPPTLVCWPGACPLFNTTLQGGQTSFFSLSGSALKLVFQFCFFFYQILTLQEGQLSHYLGWSKFTWNNTTINYRNASWYILLTGNGDCPLHMWAR